MKTMKFSKWIRLAVADVKKVVKSPKYKFDLSEWHEPNGTCKVCFAGARMMGLGGNPEKELYPGDFTEKDQLNALDELRCGGIDDSLDYYYGKVYKKLQPLVEKYNSEWDYQSILTPNKRKTFYKDMLGFADELEKLGY